MLKECPDLLGIGWEHLRGQNMLKECPDHLGVGWEGGHKRSMGLEVLRVFLVDISLVREDWCTGYCLHVNEGILSVFVPYRGIVFLILGDNRNPDDIHEWHTSNAMYSTQDGLNFVKYLCGGGGV
jgi:hypothetical protein